MCWFGFFRIRDLFGFYPAVAGTTTLIAVVVLIGFAGPAHAVPQGPWVLPGTDLSQPGEHAYDTQVAVAGDGAVTAVWTRYNGSVDIVQTSTRPPGGDWSPVENLSSASGDASDPQIAIGGEDTATVVWLSDTGTYDRVQSSTRPLGAGFGSIENLSTTGQDTRAVEVAIGGDGTTTAIWTEDNGANYLARTSTRPPEGSFAPAEFISAAGKDARLPHVVVGPQGDTVTIWLREDASGDQIVQTRTKPKSGAYGLIQNLSAAGQSSIRPGLAVGPDGSIVTIWARDDGSDDIVQTRSRPANGIFGPVENLSAPGEDGGDPQVTFGPDGTTAAAWFRSIGPNDVLQARVRPQGGTFGPTETLTGTLVIAGDLGMASAPDGTVSVVWYSKIAADYLTQTATRPPGGSFGEPEMLSAPGENSSYPDIAIGPDGVATAVWTRYDGSSDIAQSASTLSASVLKVTRTGSGMGTVTSAPGGIDCGPVCDGLFSFYAPVTLTATPAPRSRFTGWSGDCSGTGSTCLLDPTEARAATARFCPRQKLSLKKLKRNRKKGLARLTVKAGGKGKVVLKGSKRVRKSVSVVGAGGKGKLLVKAKSKTARKLKKKGKVKLKVKLIYKPGGDCPGRTKTRKLKLVRK
jgi:Divergent InlB B-repeat domain